MVKPIWQEEFLVRSYEVDFKNKLKLHHLFNYMQEIAGEHAVELGFGYDELKSRNLFWVLSKAKIEMEKYPVWGDRIIIETWPKAINKIYAVRDFNILNDRGERIAGATTAWLLLDAATFKPQRIASLELDFHLQQDRHGLKDALEKLNTDSSQEFLQERTVLYCDMDINQHMNNARYVEWILDSLPVDFHQERQIRSIQINYLSEVKAGDSVTLRKGQLDTGEKEFFLDGIHTVTGSKVFQSKIGWREED